MHMYTSPAHHSHTTHTSLLSLIADLEVSKPFVRQPRGDTRVTPDDKRRAVAQRTAEIAERRAVFVANNNK